MFINSLIIIINYAFVLKINDNQDSVSYEESSRGFKPSSHPSEFA